MKKVISLTLAFVLMFSICIPAFATDLTLGSQSGSSTVNVRKETAGASFVVTIPPTVDIKWETVETNIEYSISSQLATGTFVKVTVKADVDGKMKNTDNSASLDYSLKSNTTEYTTTKSVIPVDAPEKASAVVTIPLENWRKASIDNYTGTLTFEATVV